MSLHVHGSVVTSRGIAANNRGETEGNITTLQKLFWKGELHTTVSAEAIRFAIRYWWQRQFETTKDGRFKVNRNYDEASNSHRWVDQTWSGWQQEDGETFIDDDVLGFMLAEAAKEEATNEDAAASGKTKARRAKGKTTSRRGVLEVTRALSLTPFLGEMTFNAKSGVKERTSLYGSEVHATAYQYGFSITPDRLRVRDRVKDALAAVASLGEVGGNHSRFLFDFSPDTLILRVTQDPAPRILFCFEANENGEYACPELIRRIQAADVDPKELVIAGAISSRRLGDELRGLGVQVDPGVKSAVESVARKL